MSAAVTDSQIRRAAIELGFFDATVFTHLDRDWHLNDESEAKYAQPFGGERVKFVCLSVRRHAGDDWQLLGRRRTWGELLTMLEAFGSR